MKVIVMGYGRIGSQVCKLLTDQKHDVTIIDHDANADARLGQTFKGRLIRGLGFDRNVLLQAGIEQAEAFRGSQHVGQCQYCRGADSPEYLSCSSRRRPFIRSPAGGNLPTPGPGDSLSYELGC